MELTTDEVITYLIDSEWDEKHNRRLARLTRAAYSGESCHPFRVKVATYSFIRIPR
jgi:hypothetical protein